MSKLVKIRTAYAIMIILFVIIQILITQNQIIASTEENLSIIEEFYLETKFNHIEELNQEKSPTTTQSWKIEIPKISLEAEISEGTSKETLNKYVGHFEKTQKEEGNIGLAAHNRGYDVNYFQNLKLLQKGDEIRYKYKEFEKIYEVEKCKIIKDTDWNYLENTEDNRLTLITCVENQPEYRRCIQAIEKEESKY